MSDATRKSGQRCSQTTIGLTRELAVAHEFGIRLALIAFATASIQGVFQGTEFRGSLTAALVCLALFYVVGLVCGELTKRVIEEQLKLNPTNTVSTATTSNRN